MLKFANLKPFLTSIPAESTDFPVAQSLLGKLAEVEKSAILDIATTGSGDTGQPTPGNVNHYGNNEEIVNVSGNDVRDTQPTRGKTPGLEESLMEPSFNELKVEEAEKDSRRLRPKVSSWDLLKAKYKK